MKLYLLQSIDKAYTVITIGGSFNKNVVMNMKTKLTKTNPSDDYYIVCYDIDKKFKEFMY